jgi:hypothetical protein
VNEFANPTRSRSLRHSYSIAPSAGIDARLSVSPLPNGHHEERTPASHQAAPTVARTVPRRRFGRAIPLVMPVTDGCGRSGTHAWTDARRAAQFRAHCAGWALPPVSTVGALAQEPALFRRRSKPTGPTRPRSRRCSLSPPSPGDKGRRLSAAGSLLFDARANIARLTSTSPISEPVSSAERRAWRTRAPVRRAAGD